MTSHYLPEVKTVTRDADHYVVNVGDRVIIRSHPISVSSVNFLLEEFVGVVTRIRFSQKYDDYELWVEREDGGSKVTFLQHVKSPTKNKPKKKVKKGPQTIICQGYELLDSSHHDCNAERVVHASDLHLVKRCQKCQQEHNRLQARRRRAARLEQKIDKLGESLKKVAESREGQV